MILSYKARSSVQVQGNLFHYLAAYHWFQSRWTVEVTYTKITKMTKSKLIPHWSFSSEFKKPRVRTLENAASRGQKVLGIDLFS